MVILCNILILGACQSLFEIYSSSIMLFINTKNNLPMTYVTLTDFGYLVSALHFTSSHRILSYFVFNLFTFSVHDKVNSRNALCELSYFLVIPVVCRRANVCFMLFVFVCAKRCPTRLDSMSSMTVVFKEAGTTYTSRAPCLVDLFSSF